MIAAISYNPGYLLIVAFDIVFASCFVPLVAAVYFPAVTPNAGLLSCVAGCVTRIALELTLPKDGSTIAWGAYALAYGKALPGLPAFMTFVPPSAEDASLLWSPEKDTCDQAPLSDWTGLDSLVSPVVYLLVLVAITLLEPLLDGAAGGNARASGCADSIGISSAGVASIFSKCGMIAQGECRYARPVARVIAIDRTENAARPHGARSALEAIAEPRLTVSPVSMRTMATTAMYSIEPSSVATFTTSTSVLVKLKAQATDCHQDTVGYSRCDIFTIRCETVAAISLAIARAFCICASGVG